MKIIFYFTLSLIIFTFSHVTWATSTIDKNSTLTPFGIRPNQCIHEHPSGTTIRELANGVEAIEPNGHKQFYPTQKKCLEADKQWKATTTLLRNWREGKSPTEFTTTKWLDNAWWYPPSPVTMISGDYTVPNNPRAGRLRYWLYYFLGMVNFQSNVETSILQPVLAWTTTGWSFTSWNCCPAGQVHNAQAIFVAARSQLKGKVTQSGNQWVIDSAAGSRHSTLRVAGINRVFNYVDATLEIYYVNDCSYYPTEPVTYNNITIQLQNGAIATPRWSKTSPTECNGRVNILSPKKITIQHN